MQSIDNEQSVYSPMLSSNNEYDAFDGITDEWTSFGLHIHDFFEFYISFNGMPYYVMDEIVFPLQTCTLIIIPPFYLHGPVSSHSPKDYDRSWIYVRPPLLQTIGMGLPNLSEIFKNYVKEGKYYFYIDRETGDTLRNYIKQIQTCMNSRSPVDQWQNRITIAQFLAMVHEIASKSQVTSSPIVLNSTIQSVLNYINNHFTTAITLADISKEFNISTSYLSRSFSAYTGWSIYDYVLYRRIMLAKEMIVAGKSFTEISFECGFNDYSCFLRAFTKVVKQTPRDYKKFISEL